MRILKIDRKFKAGDRRSQAEISRILVLIPFDAYTVTDRIIVFIKNVHVVATITVTEKS